MEIKIEDLDRNPVLVAEYFSENIEYILTKRPSKTCEYIVGSREYRRDTYLRSVYNITLKEYNLLLEKQNYRCAICNKHQNKLKKNLSVDHCHTTGKVRGLLCQNCNPGIGYLKDNITYLENAIKYLKHN